MFWETEKDVPAGDENHVVSEIFPLDLGFLNDYDVCFEDVEHCLDVVSEADRACEGEGGGCGRPRMFASLAMADIRKDFWHVRCLSHAHPNGS